MAPVKLDAGVQALILKCMELQEDLTDEMVGLARQLKEITLMMNKSIKNTEKVYVDTVGDPKKYKVKLSARFPSIEFVVAKKVDSLYPVVSGASIVAKVTRDRYLRNWKYDETAENMHREFGSGYLGDPATKNCLEHHKHPVVGFPSLVRFSWGTCSSYFKGGVEVLW
ncbi:hypothetical protein OROHE_000865 [Orobanche hederae]